MMPIAEAEEGHEVSDVTWDDIRTPIPKRLLPTPHLLYLKFRTACKGMRKSEVLVWLYLFAGMRLHDHIYKTTAKKLAAILPISSVTAKRTLASLRKKGWIKCTERGRWCDSSYLVTAPELRDHYVIPNSGLTGDPSLQEDFLQGST